MDASTAVETGALLAIALVGFVSWSFTEYAIHGLLSHRWKTPVSPIHWGHHKTPRAVFTGPLAWIPAALAVWGLGALTLGAATSAAFVLGQLVGFARYEHIHWRIHFRRPRNERERMLRNHHLAHHYRRPTHYHGVTTRFWDRVFGTIHESWESDYARFDDHPPIEGPSNLRAGWSLHGVRHALAELRSRPAP